MTLPTTPITLWPTSYPDIVLLAQKFIDGVSSWKQDGSYKSQLLLKSDLKNSHSTSISVSTSSSTIEGVHWSARSTDFSALTPEQRRSVYHLLSKFLAGSSANDDNHTHYEREYIHDLAEYTIQNIDSVNSESLSSDSSTSTNDILYLAQLVYKLSFPLSRRVFHELIYIYRPPSTSESTLQEFLVVSLPVDPVLYKKEPTPGASRAVAATYTSVEKVSYDSSADNLLWTMCTCANPGGLVPRFLADSSLSKVISHDVPLFLNWASKK